MPHVFLTDPWLDGFEQLTRATPGAMPPDARVTLVITGGPDGDRTVHVDDGVFGRGPLAWATTTITLPYEVAKAMFVDGNPTVPAQAWMAGRIKVDGDFDAIMQIAPPPTRDDNDPFQAKVRALTAG